MAGGFSQTVPEKLFLFDFDGVLVDSLSLYEKSVNLCLETDRQAADREPRGVSRSLRRELLQRHREARRRRGRVHGCLEGRDPHPGLRRRQALLRTHPRAGGTEEAPWAGHHLLELLLRDPAHAREVRLRSPTSTTSWGPISTSARSRRSFTPWGITGQTAGTPFTFATRRGMSARRGRRE